MNQAGSGRPYYLRENTNFWESRKGIRQMCFVQSNHPRRHQLQTFGRRFTMHLAFVNPPIVA